MHAYPSESPIVSDLAFTRSNLTNISSISVCGLSNPSPHPEPIPHQLGEAIGEAIGDVREISTFSWTSSPIGIARSLAAPPSHTTQHTGPYCAVRLIRQNQTQGNKDPSDHITRLPYRLFLIKATQSSTRQAMGTLVKN